MDGTGYFQRPGEFIFKMTPNQGCTKVENAKVKVQKHAKFRRNESESQ